MINRPIFFLFSILIVSSPVISNAVEESDEKEHAAKRITLQKTDVIGSQELPRVMSIISWQKTKPIDQPLLHRRNNMAFDPIDEKEFVREITYRQKMDIE